MSANFLPQNIAFASTDCALLTDKKNVDCCDDDSVFMHCDLDLQGEAQAIPHQEVNDLETIRMSVAAEPTFMAFASRSVLIGAPS